MNRHYHQHPASKSRFTKVYSTTHQRPVHVLKKDNRTGPGQHQRRLHFHASAPAFHQQTNNKLMEKSCSDYVQLRQVMATQKELLAKLEKATSAEEKTAISESLKLAVFHAKDLQKELQEKHKVLVEEVKKKNYTKVNSLKRSASVSSSCSSSEDQSSSSTLKRCRFDSGSSSSSNVSVSSKKSSN